MSSNIGKGRCDNCLNIVVLKTCNLCCNGDITICPICKYCHSTGSVLGYDQFNHEISILKHFRQKVSDLDDHHAIALFNKMCEMCEMCYDIDPYMFVLKGISARIKELRHNRDFLWKTQPKHQ